MIHEALFFFERRQSVLPDISKRRKLYGYAKSDYDNEKLHAAISLKVHDGRTSENCVRIVRRMNQYLADSRYLVVEASAIFYFMKGLLEGDFQDSDCEIIRLYDQNIDRDLLGSSMKNVMKVIKSVASQRRLTKSVKDVIKKNRINRDWEELLIKFLDDLESRLKYVQNIVIPGNVQNTPMGAYMDYLDSKGMTIFEDIALYVENSGRFFDDDDESAEVYKDHVLQILCNLDGEATEMLLEKARSGMEYRQAKIEKIRADEAEQKLAAFAAGMDECRALVLGLCSSAGSAFRRTRMTSLLYYSKRCADVWVIAAATVKPRHSGYLRKSGKGRFYVSGVSNASIWETEEAAKEAAAIFCEQEGHVAEVSKVELYAYGIGI